MANVLKEDMPESGKPGKNAACEGSVLHAVCSSSTILSMSDEVAAGGGVFVDRKVQVDPSSRTHLTHQVSPAMSSGDLPAKDREAIVASQVQGTELPWSFSQLVRSNHRSAGEAARAFEGAISSFVRVLRRNPVRLSCNQVQSGTINV